jgi:hypothetical protein
MATASARPYVVSEHVAPPEAGVRSGWVTFAGVAFLIAAFANLFWGLAALDERSYLLVNGLLWSTLNTWGWAAVIWSAVVLVGALLLLFRVSWAPLVGVALASLSAIFWLFALPVLPLFALTAIMLDMLVIYGLVAHGMATD